MTWFMLASPVLAMGITILAFRAGRRSRGATPRALSQRHDLRRAQGVIAELEKITRQVRHSLATHHASIQSFRERIGQIQQREHDPILSEIAAEAERMLKPTLELSNDIARAYDQIRQQTHLLMTFTELRVDPLTGVGNRRAMEESLQSYFALKARYDTKFSVVMLDIDHFKQINDRHGHLQGDQVLKDTAARVQHLVRETDIVTRFGGEEFLVILPETDLAGATIFGKRLREIFESEMPATISVGIAEALDSETPDGLIARVDSALYSAKSAGRNNVFLHSGSLVLSAEDSLPTLSMAHLQVETPQMEAQSA